MSWRIAICALLLTVVMMPGAMEVAENAVHLLTAGHSAHSEAPDGVDHHPERGSEHGCTPLMHLCGCHASLASLDASAPHNPPDPRLDRRSGRTVQPSLRAGFDTGVERPPRV